MYVFCSLCLDSYHPGSRCMSPESALELMRQRAAGNKNATADFKRKARRPRHLAL